MPVHKAQRIKVMVLFKILLPIAEKVQIDIVKTAF